VLDDVLRQDAVDDVVVIRKPRPNVDLTIVINPSL
jgi:hypothetical protein